MCIVKTPKIERSDPKAKTPEPTVIRNPYLDGLDPASKALRRGRSSLRIERGGGRGATSTAPPPAVDTLNPSPTPLLRSPNPVLPKIKPVLGGGGGGVGRINRRAVRA